MRFGDTMGACQSVLSQLNDGGGAQCGGVCSNMVKAYTHSCEFLGSAAVRQQIDFLRQICGV